MSQETPCAKCGSSRIVPLAAVEDQGQHSDHKLKAAVYRNPDAWVFKGAVQTVLRAKVCGDCGYTELFATDAAGLYEAYQSITK